MYRLSESLLDAQGLAASLNTHNSCDVVKLLSLVFVIQMYFPIIDKLLGKTTGIYSVFEIVYSPIVFPSSTVELRPECSLPPRADDIKCTSAKEIMFLLSSSFLVHLRFYILDAVERGF